MKIGLLFDLDGTLLDTLEDLADATNHTLRHFGCPERSLEQIRQIVGNGALRQITGSLPGRSEDPSPEEALAYYKAYYAAHSRIKTAPYPGIPEALEALAEKYPIAVVSNKPDPVVKALCSQCFPGYYALGEAAGCPRKPAPDMVFRAMAAIGADRCIYIGDTEVDIQTAANAGAVCVTVLWGFRDKPQLEAAGACRFCAHPAQLPQIVDQIAGELYGQ